MSILIKGMEMPKNCGYCPIRHLGGDGDECFLGAKITEYQKRPDDCPLIPVPDHGGLFDVNQFEKGCFYGYGHDGRVYKLFWDERVFEGAKKFYINPIIPADKEDGE